MLNVKPYERVLYVTVGVAVCVLVVVQVVKLSTGAVFPVFPRTFLYTFLPR